jgi:hypothetical protein
MITLTILCFIFNIYFYYRFKKGVKEGTYNPNWLGNDLEAFVPFALTFLTIANFFFVIILILAFLP